MIAMLATFTWLATAQAINVRRDTVAAPTTKDSTTAVIATSVVSGIPLRTATRISLTPATFAVAEGIENTDSVPAQRRHAVDHSEWYYRRLTIHKAASFTTIPLFVTEYVLGDKLFKGTASSSTKSAHSAAAMGIGVLFGVNTITGVWNLWDSRHESAGKARRTTHALLMLASDAGFVATAALAPGGDNRFGDGRSNNQNTHRAVAIGSMGVSLVSYLMMYLWK